MNPINSAARNTEALVDLLENILVNYKDSDSRPERSLSLYRQWRQLSSQYRVRIARGLVLIDGGAPVTLLSLKTRRRRRKRNKAHLKLMPNVTPLVILP